MSPDRPGNAYVAPDGAVYFDVQSFPEYGELSGNTLEALRSGEGGRVDMATQAVKRHPSDFMLWKPDANHVAEVGQSLGRGLPGMAPRVLGHGVRTAG